jgi:hypothetical protein
MGKLVWARQSGRESPLVVDDILGPGCFGHQHPVADRPLSDRFKVIGATSTLHGVSIGLKTGASVYRPRCYKSDGAISRSP